MLDEPALRRHARALARRDADLARIFAALGPPPLWAREPGFATLVLIILEQQVSLASARAAYDRLAARLGTVEPDAFLTLGDAELKAIGFSRQKTRYARLLAEAVLSGALDLPALAGMSDDAARAGLIALKGVGQWSASIYLLMVLRRADVWPAGDIALQTAWQRLRGLPQRPGSDELAGYAERWRPYRAVAARLLWHFYLSKNAPPGLS